MERKTWKKWTGQSRSHSAAGTGCMCQVNKLSDEAHFDSLGGNKKLQISNINILQAVFGEDDKMFLRWQRMRPSQGTVPSIKDVFPSCNPERPTSRPSLPSSLYISLRLCQDLDHKHPSAQRYSPVLSQTYRRSTEGQRGQTATDSLNDHSMLPGAKVTEMGASRTRQVLRCRASSHLNKKKTNHWRY